MNTKTDNVSNLHLTQETQQTHSTQVMQESKKQKPQFEKEVKLLSQGKSAKEIFGDNFKNEKISVHTSKSGLKTEIKTVFLKDGTQITAEKGRNTYVNQLYGYQEKYSANGEFLSLTPADNYAKKIGEGMKKGNSIEKTLKEEIKNTETIKQQDGKITRYTLKDGTVIDKNKSGYKIIYLEGEDRAKALYFNNEGRYTGGASGQAELILDK